MIRNHKTITPKSIELPKGSVIIPVCNEAHVLPKTAAALKRALRGMDFEVIYVCNGVTDASVLAIENVFRDEARIIRLAKANKTAALNAGDVAATRFPRFYLDADISFEPATLHLLQRTLQAGEADLVGARITSDTRAASRWARATSEVWLSLPHARRDAFQGLIGFSKAGRDGWQELPDIIADDSYITSCVPSERRIHHDEVTLYMPLPLDFWSWVRVRARWLQGQREMKAIGRPIPASTGQSRELLSGLRRPSWAPKVFAFLSVRLLASAWCRFFPRKKDHWERDESTRI